MMKSVHKYKKVTKQIDYLFVTVKLQWKCSLQIAVKLHAHIQLELCA